ncbi:MAG: AsmA-like C-terminal region-containing protein [Bacteroidales bacterium]|nr:AsmA-like C-terminal region-containing protein [Bacteroidales bacterium]MDT8430380.1 AsmA-like C-terminal region-containing protein [Bacteroidales bacterium]
MRKIRIFLEYLAAFLIIFVLLSVITSIVIVKFYGDDVQEYTMDLINDQLDTKISVGEMGISVLRRFPNTSVFFNDVTVWSGHRFDRTVFGDVPPDTLFVADRLYLQFNLPDLLRKKFTIKSLEAREGILRILIDGAGNGNFMVRDPKDDTGAGRPIEMKGVTLRDLDIQYINVAKEIRSHILLEEISLEGNFGNRDYMLKASGNAYVENIINHGVYYLSGQDVSTNVFLEVNNNHFTISRGEMMIGDLTAAITGEFLVDKEVGADLDLHFSGEKINIEWVSRILSSSKKSPGITGRGNINLAVDVTGLTSPTLSPHITARFSTKNASLQSDRIPLELKSLSAEGTYTNGNLMSVRSTVINLHSFSARSGASEVSGSVRLEDLLRPSFNIVVKGDVSLTDLDPWLKGLPLHTGDGKIYPDLRITGTISDLSDSTRNVTFDPVGTLGVNDVEFLLTGPDLHFREIGGNVFVDSKTLNAGLTGYMNDTDFDLEFSLMNPLAAFTSDPRIDIRGTLSSSNLNIDQLSGEMKQDRKKTGPFSFPDYLALDLDFKFDRITKGQLHTKQVSGNITYKYPGLTVDPFYLETMNGSVNGRVALFDLHQPRYQVNMHSTFRNVEISDVFRSFNNFGQDFLTYENIEGSISGESEFLAPLNNDFSINTSGIISENSFVIRDGELNDFQPLIALSDFLKIDKMDQVQFSNISNTILINNNMITIPAMDIRSNALNLQASGYHSFDKTYEYHLATRLSELLFNKAKSNPDKEFNIALDKEDRRTIFLVLFDEGDGMMIKFDEEQAMKKIQEDLRKEKQELKNVLKDAFGNTGKEEQHRENTGKTEQPVFKFEFPGEEPQDTQPPVEEKRKWWQRKKDTTSAPGPKFIIDDNDL